jgi:cytochrome c peroxidase
MKQKRTCNYIKKAGLILAASALLAYPALAADAPSLERGKELFNSTKLGTSGKSCATCHPEGKRLNQAATYKEGELGEIINQCIKNPLKGAPLEVTSGDMKSLIIYIKTFAGPGKL